MRAVFKYVSFPFKQKRPILKQKPKRKLKGKKTNIEKITMLCEYIYNIYKYKPDEFDNYQLYKWR
ncbi:MAG: hypothetical protein ACOC1O_00285 [bacterium]